jgi:hypothetical protein
MLGAVGAGGGSVLGGLLGQAGDALSAPRRALWTALGGPEHGNELVGQLTGMDPQSALARALGVGAEVFLDPLTIGGGLAGGLLGKGYAAAASRGRALEQEANALLSARMAGNEALAAGGQAAQAARQALPGVIDDVGRADLAGIGSGATKTFKQASPEVIAAFEQANLGRGAQPAGLEIFGRELPQGAALSPVVTETGQLTKAGLPKKVMGGKAVAVGPDGLPQLQPWERQFLMDQMATGQAGDLAHTLAVERGARSLPAGALGEVVPGAATLPMGQMPLRQGLAEIEATLPDVLRQLERYTLRPADYAQIGAAGLGGVGLGGYLGGR